MTTPDKLGLYVSQHAVISQKYDVDFGYGPLYVVSIHKKNRRLGARAPLDPLVRDGVAVVPALSAQECAAVSEALDESDGGVVGPDALGRKQVFALVERLLEGAAGEAIRAMYGCPVLPVYISGLRHWSEGVMAAKGRRTNSTKWHCDAGPTHQSRILVYLNGPEQHDGATWVADLASTQALKRAGYVFTTLDQRVEDLDPLVRTLGLPFEPSRYAPESGNALLFEPSQRLHKGDLPTRGHRDTLQLGLVPAQLPWRPFLEDNWEVVAANFGHNWPNMRQSSAS